MKAIAAFCIAAGLVTAGPAMAQAVPPPVVTSVPAAASAPLDPAKVEIGHQIIAIAFPPENRRAMMDKLMAAMLAQMRQGMMSNTEDPGLRKIMDNMLDSIPGRLEPTVQAFLPKMFEAMSHAYARQFSVGELNDILVFAKTPSGQHYLQHATDIMSDPDIAAANAEYFRDLQVPAQKMRGDFANEIVTYMKAHPAVAKKMAIMYFTNPKV